MELKTGYYTLLNTQFKVRGHVIAIVMIIILMSSVLVVLQTRMRAHLPDNHSSEIRSKIRNWPTELFGISITHLASMISSVNPAHLPVDILSTGIVENLWTVL